VYVAFAPTLFCDRIVAGAGDARAVSHRRPGQLPGQRAGGDFRILKIEVEMIIIRANLLSFFWIALYRSTSCRFRLSAHHTCTVAAIHIVSRHYLNLVSINS
jgi:hypothetical protein